MSLKKIQTTLLELYFGILVHLNYLIWEEISIKKVLIASMFLVILLSACQANEELSFVGESEHWSSNVTVYQSNGDETYQMEINYKESSLQDIINFNYYVKTKSNAIDYEENNASLNKQGIYYKKLPISNSPTTSKKDEFVITVEWDGNSEDFTLTSK